MNDYDFNPHPYVRDDKVTIDGFTPTVDFNPHPYVRDDMLSRVPGHMRVISIHIPT